MLLLFELGSFFPWEGLFASVAIAAAAAAPAGEREAAGEEEEVDDEEGEEDESGTDEGNVAAEAAIVAAVAEEEEEELETFFAARAAFALASAPFSTNLSELDLDIALVAGLMNLEELKGSPEGVEPGALGSSSVSRASAATIKPGGPSQNSSCLQEASVTTLWRIVKS